MSIDVLADDQYSPQSYDAVLVKGRTVLCLRGADGDDGDDEEAPPRPLARVLPLEKLHHVDAPPELMVQGREVPESFHGGCEYGFVDTEQFPDLVDREEEIDREVQ